MSFTSRDSNFNIIMITGHSARPKGGRCRMNLPSILKRFGYAIRIRPCTEAGNFSEGNSLTQLSIMQSPQ